MSEITFYQTTVGRYVVTTTQREPSAPWTSEVTLAVPMDVIHPGAMGIWLEGPVIKDGDFTGTWATEDEAEAGHLRIEDALRRRIADEARSG
jgi:hypothetical protein